MLHNKEIYTFKEYTEHERIIRINLLKCCDIGSRMTHFGLPGVKIVHPVVCRIIEKNIGRGRNMWLY
jgi:hypothetical protein